MRNALPLRLALPALESFLAENVEKEVRKDALAIGRAAELLVAGGPPGMDAVRQLVEATKAIDREFLDRAQNFPVRISIHYDEIAPARMKRIERLLGAAYRILAAWDAEQRLRPAVCASFPQRDLEGLLRELLQLYALETRALSRAVGLPTLLTPLRDHVAQRLFDVMDHIAASLAGEVARGVYRRAVTNEVLACTKPAA